MGVPRAVIDEGAGQDAGEQGNGLLSVAVTAADRLPDKIAPVSAR